MHLLFNLEMSESGSISYHINEFNMTISQFSSIKIDFDEVIKALILLLSLLESWNIIVSVINTSHAYEKLKFDEIQDIFLMYESIHIKIIDDSYDNAFNIEGRGRSKQRGSNVRHVNRIQMSGENLTVKVMVFFFWNYNDNGYLRSIVQNKNKIK